MTATTSPALDPRRDGATSPQLATPVPTTQGVPLVRTLRDTWLMYRRSLILTLRQP